MIHMAVFNFHIDQWGHRCLRFCALIRLSWCWLKHLQHSLKNIVVVFAACIATAVAKSTSSRNRSALLAGSSSTVRAVGAATSCRLFLSLLFAFGASEAVKPEAGERWWWIWLFWWHGINGMWWRFYNITQASRDPSEQPVSNGWSPFSSSGGNAVSAAQSARQPNPSPELP